MDTDVSCWLTGSLIDCPYALHQHTQVDDIYENRMGDRVGMYFSTWISHLADNEFVVTPRCNSWNNASYEGGLGAKIITGAKIVTAPVWKRVVQQKAKQEGSSAHEKDMEAFYKFQKEGK